MSTPKRRDAAQLAPAPTVAPTTAAPLPAYQFPPELLREAMVEGFARAFESQIQGAPMEALLEAIQLTTDLRLFKESLFLTEEQVIKMLQLSGSTFDRLKRSNKIEVDRHLGERCLRYSLFDIIQARQKARLEAGPSACIRPKKGK